MMHSPFSYGTCFPGIGIEKRLEKDPALGPRVLYCSYFLHTTSNGMLYLRAKRSCVVCVSALSVRDMQPCRSWEARIRRPSVV